MNDYRNLDRERGGRLIKLEQLWIDEELMRNKHNTSDKKLDILTIKQRFVVRIVSATKIFKKRPF